VANNLYGQDGLSLRELPDAGECGSGGRSKAGVAVLVGRQRELAALEGVLRRACDGSGSCLVVWGPAGSGKTVLADATVTQARRLGVEVVRASVTRGLPGRWVWAQVLGDVGAVEGLAARLLERAGPREMDDAARALVARTTRVIVVDDVDRGGDEAITLLAAVVARLGASHTAVVVTSSVALGLGREVVLGPLSEPELGLACGVVDAAQRHGLWVASRGLPGPAHALMASLPAEDADPVVHWALAASSTAEFLNVDMALVRLLELAIPRARQDGTRARVLARLAHELLGDASAGTRRRALADEALMLARRSGDERIVSEVLNARLHALWDPAGADDRLETAAAIIDLARRAGDDQAERQGLFWRFIALMEPVRRRLGPPSGVVGVVLSLR
jgi:AAA ATPase domain